MLLRFVVKLIMGVALFITAVPSFSQTISLAGQWRFAVDRDDTGIKEQWFYKKLADVINLPGSMTAQNKGDGVTLQTKWTGSIYDSSFFFRPSLAKYRQPDNLKIPFWLTPLKHYVGIAWYQKEVVIPASYKNKRVVLFLERAHIQTTVWIDAIELGKQNSLVAPHEFTLPQSLAAGKHTITIRINNSIKEMNVGPDSHSVTDHTQGNWNGVVGKIFLKTMPAVYIENVQVYPDIKNRKAVVKVTLLTNDTKAASGKIWLSAKSFNTKISHIVTPVGANFTIRPNDSMVTEINFPLGDKMQLWDEFDPALYKLTVSLIGNKVKDVKQVQFGMREIKVAALKLQLNGRPLYLRGDVNNCEFPLTGYAPMNVADWERVFKIAKSFGFNHMRFHSWCPPEAAFAAADKYGFYLQPEGPSWPNHGTSLGDGRFIDNYIYEETARMAKAYGNHPSFCMLSAGNEPAGRNQAKYLGEFVKYWQAKDSRRVYTGASVAMSWPLYPESDYMIKSGPRGLNWNNTRPETVSDYHTAIETFKVPYITHEMGQWCVFPDFKEIKKYTGATRAKNFELFAENLGDHGMADKAERFLMASGKLQALCYKQEIEKSLRTKNGAGFQLLGLQDFPGQGTALVGVLNAFWEEKGYISAKEWSRFCNSTVPLSRIEKFTYTNNETFNAAIEIYHYGKKDLQNVIINWTIKDETGKVIKKDVFPTTTIITGTNTSIGNITMPLSAVTKASKLTLEVAILNTPFINDWDFWVYPQTVSIAANNIYYTDTLDAKAETILNNGGSVFLNAAGKIVKGKEVIQYFTPVFWNTSWFKMRPPHTLGILLDPKHPAFTGFPSAFYSDLQWWEIVNKAQVMNLEDFPKGFQPLLQPIDTWFMNRRLALILEAKVGNGKLIVSSANLSDSTAHPAARQLLYSIKKYMLSPQFNPKDKVALPVIKDLFRSPSKELWDSYSKANPDELKPVQNAPLKKN